MQFDAAQSVFTTIDGGFIILGNSKSSDADLLSNAGENDLWVIKADQDGKLTWQKSFGGTGLDFGFDALETDDNGIILVGETASPDFLGLPNKGQTDMVLLKIKVIPLPIRDRSAIEKPYQPIRYNNVRN